MEQRTIDDGELRQWIDEWGEESHDDILPSDDEADIANRILEHHTRGEYAGDVDWNGAWESLQGIVGPALEHVHGFFPDGAETLARYVREIDMGIVMSHILLTARAQCGAAHIEHSQQDALKAPRGTGYVATIVTENL